MTTKPQSLPEALARIDELEKQVSELQEKLHYFESKDPGGRRKHDAKWQASYNYFVNLYEQGHSILEIVEESDFSQRTAYRYKAYYDELAQKKE